jgi:hypothetical protein
MLKKAFAESIAVAAKDPQVKAALVKVVRKQPDVIYKDAGDAFPDGLPSYDGSDDDDGGDEPPLPCPNCGYVAPDADATDKAADYRRKAMDATDPDMRKGYRALAAMIEKCGVPG